MGSEDRGPGFGTGLLLGGVIGALVGVLLAPKPGEEIRSQVMEGTAGLRGMAEVVANEARDRLRDAIEEGKVVANRMMGSYLATHEPEPDLPEGLPSEAPGDNEGRPTPS